MNLWMVQTCNIDMTNCGKYKTKNEKKVNLLYTVCQNHCRAVVIVDHHKNFKGMHLMVATVEEQSKEGEIIVRN